MSEAQIRYAAYLTAIFALYLAGAMLLPAVVDYFADNPDWRVFANSALLVGIPAAACALATRSPAVHLNARFGFLLVNLLWVTASLIGAIPFTLASIGLDIADAVFESVSGLTTTGSTVISGLDGLPPGLLLWRSILQWVGGLGVVALGLFVLPLLRIGGIAFFRIESSDRSDRPFARFSTFSLALLAIYSGLTLVCAMFYAAAGMTGFDAINHAMTTLSTGGFSTHDASLGFYGHNPAVIWTGTIFMFVGGLPFSILILLALRRRLDALRDPQIAVYAAFCAIFSLSVAVFLRASSGFSLFEALTHSAFNFVSLITTTGFASADYSLWGTYPVACAFVATIIGGCSGSTAGGIKAYRFLILFEMVRLGLRQLIYPSSVASIRYGDRNIAPDMQDAAVLFISAFVVIWALALILLAATGLDFMTAATSALTALTNVGPGLGEIVGPAGNFASLPDTAKWILDAVMILGRLEILAVLVLLSPAFWN
ncbi:TrkH family potassium uptake protein [Nitratireductor mangrovi]|uniref:Trk system potassium uptake protein n=1 Tax=Nitratireductor mangrovi TaxID=2599600 RepID=A0A5B8L2A1_9HYPH|nr:TrkH family potassium uptake protein [Nitratireductor mangrovi]QDZ01648.1 TrkH family potassium uptake protein [Nitratireductor mangrovi]